MSNTTDSFNFYELPDHVQQALLEDAKQTLMSYTDEDYFVFDATPGGSNDPIVMDSFTKEGAQQEMEAMKNDPIWADTPMVVGNIDCETGLLRTAVSDIVK